MTEAQPLVLVVEDEPQMRRFLRASLDTQGFRVLEATTAKEAVELATGHAPDVILMDLGLPDEDGIALTRRIRGWSEVPIVVISARGREDDKVEALDAGADDYLTKPFGVRELHARLRVALRHRKDTAATETERTFGDVRVDFTRRVVTKANAEVHLTPTEYNLLALLLRSEGKVLTHRHILKEVWGPAYANQTHYVRVHMAELRKKIEDTPAHPRFLVTEPGVGYRLRDAESAATQGPDPK